MKRLLVSATSVMALLALDGRPAAAANFSISGNLDFGSTLVNCVAISGCVANTLTETATRSGSSGVDSITFGTPTAGTAFTGGGSTTFPGGNNTKASQIYTFSPAVTGNAGANAGQTISVQSGDKTSTFTVKGTGVAPVESVTISNPAGAGGVANSGNLGNVLVGQSATATVTVKNTGNGNTDARQATSVSNLNGKQSFSGASVFTGPGATNFSLGDAKSTSFAYTYAPTTRSSGQSTTVTSTFTDGSSDGKNTAETVTKTVSGVAVAPVEGGMTGGNAGFVLVGKSGTANVTVSNTGDGNKAGSDNGTTFLSNLHGSVSPTVAGSFTLGGSNVVNLPDASSATFAYTFAPTQRTGAAETATITGKFSNGKSDGTNAATTDSAVVSGQAVAPINSVTTTAALARFSTAGTSTGTAGVTVTNIGDGNKAGADNGTTLLSNLRGAAGSPVPSSVFTGAGGAVNLKDGQATTLQYTYAPTTRGNDSATVAVAFTNGSSDGKNQGGTVSANLSGQGVGPTYQSRVATTAAGAPTGTINTPPANSGSSAVAFGTVAAFSTATLYLDLANISIDPDGGDASLTDLSLLSFSITGAQASAFDLPGWSPTVLHEADHIVVPIAFAPGVGGAYNATLTFFTDEAAAFGAIGDSFSYSLSGLVVGQVPEPASILLLSAGLGGLLAIRRRTSKARRN